MSHTNLQTSASVPLNAQLSALCQHMAVWRELSGPFKASPTVIEIIDPANVIKR